MLKPSLNRRKNELVGLVWMAAAVMSLLSLLSFAKTDPSFHTAAIVPEVHNWVGPVGSHMADLLFQVFGIASYLIPLGLLWRGWTMFRSREAVESWVQAAGAGMFFFSLQAGLALVPYNLRFYEMFPAGGLVGGLVSDGLRMWLNRPGSAVLLGMVGVASVYLMTTFSVERTTEWASEKFAWVGAMQDRMAQIKANVSNSLRFNKPAGKVASKPLQMPSPPVAVRATQVVEMEPEPIAEDAYGEPEPEMEPEPIPVELPISTRAFDSPRYTPPAPRVTQTYQLPSTSLLFAPEGPQEHRVEDLKRMAQVLTSKCQEFDVLGQVVQINPGPVVTTYEFKPEAGVKYNRITNLVDDLCLAMEAESILIERIPGKSTVGIEVPNPQREIIRLREILEADAFTAPKSPLTVALGKEINGKLRVADLASMPHLLIAGSTGSGKSVAMNSLILSILFKSTPDEVKMILVDPKRLELGLYEGIPHLITPIITDPKVAANALRNSVKEMERRLKLLAEKGVRNIDQYNKLFDKPESMNLFEPESEHRRLPYIVIFIDELADLMMVDSNNVEFSITRLAQMARAVGIHLVLATQRPSVDVITGLIKANFPSRISFRVATKVDSRTILDTNGAEALLGKGDMLFSPPGSGRLVRVHSPLVTEAETAQVIEFWRNQATPSYEEEYLKAPISDDDPEIAQEDLDGEKDEMYEQAVRVVVEMGKASTSILQRRLRLGYGRAARLLDVMERDGIIGPPDGSKPREVLKRPDWFSEMDRSRVGV
jgi:S-DNA-T family DNA segregation ATPase FtsK/SpoIIIE